MPSRIEYSHEYPHSSIPARKPSAALPAALRAPTPSFPQSPSDTLCSKFIQANNQNGMDLIFSSVARLDTTPYYPSSHGVLYIICQLQLFFAARDSHRLLYKTEVTKQAGHSDKAGYMMVPLAPNHIYRPGLHRASKAPPPQYMSSLALSQRLGSHRSRGLR